MTPQRIQLKRIKGWRKPEGAVVVSRPTKWGNPFTVWQYPGTDTGWWSYFAADRGFDTKPFRTHTDAVRSAVHCYRVDIETRLATGELDIRELAGKDLCCWCPLVDAGGNPLPCHADVLLEICRGAS